MIFPTHCPGSAPEASRPILAGAKKSFGFVPNLLATMAEAPALLKAYTTLSSIFEESSFSATERQVVLLTASRENGCEYCVAAHTVIAGMQKVPGDVVASVRSGDAPADARLAALSVFTAAVTNSRGWPTEEETRAFLAAGYREQQVLEVVLGIGLKTLSNYTNHIAGTPLDEQFQSACWTKAA